MPGPPAWLSVFGRVWIVYRQRRRAVSLVRTAAGSAIILASALAGTAVLQLTLYRGLSSGPSAPGLLAQALTSATIATTIVLLVSAALLGAGAAPPKEAEDEIQASLLAHLRPFDICTGRLVSALLPALIALAVSCLFWLAAQTAEQILKPAQGEYVAFVVAHLVILCAVLMIGAVSLSGAMRSKPGRARGRGVAAGMVVAGLAVGSLYLATPSIRSMEDPTQLIDRCLLVNPVVAVQAALNKDILRAAWIYNVVSAADYPFEYPPPLASAAVFLSVAAAAHMLAAVQLRRAFR